MVTSIDAKSIAKQFVDACRKEGIPVREAILFGSYAKGVADKNSDIDLALVSDSFGNNIIENSEQTALLNYRFADIEVHHFSSDEFERNTPFVNEIKRTGIRIY